MHSADAIRLAVSIPATPFSPLIFTKGTIWRDGFPDDCYDFSAYYAVQWPGSVLDATRLVL